LFAAGLFGHRLARVCGDDDRRSRRLKRASLAKVSNWCS